MKLTRRLDGDPAAWRRYMSEIRALRKKATPPPCAPPGGAPLQTETGTAATAGTAGTACKPMEGDEALRALVEQNLLWVASIAREYASFGLPLEDLLAEGNLGLLEAAGRFDGSRGTKFITYASWWIRKRIFNFIARQVGALRLPRYKLERLRRLREAEKVLRARLQRAPLTDELAVEAGLAPREVENLRLLSQRTLSLEAMARGEEGTPLLDRLPEEPEVESPSGLIEQDYERFLAARVARLPGKQRLVVSLRFGFGGEPPRTLREIARILGVSRERVRQIESQALDRIRRTLRPDPSEDQPPSRAVTRRGRF